MQHEVVSTAAAIPVRSFPESGQGVLVIEDNQVNAMILRAMLRKRGHEPLVAADGASGVELAERHRPRLVLMDLQMPRLDGFAAAAAIRRFARPAEVTMVAVTASAAGDVRSACLEAGFASVLAKPVIFEELTEIVRRHMGDGPLTPRPASPPGC